jgi:hypothetical protein
MKRLGVTLVLCLAALAAAAAAAVAGPLGDPHREQERLTAADMALAKRIALRATDLPTGWRRTPVPPDNDEFKCPGFDPDLSRFTITGKAQSAFTHPGGAQVLSAEIGRAHV